MNRRIRHIIIITFCAIAFAVSKAQALDLAKPLSGRILLQVEKRGQAWYVDPVKYRRAFLGFQEDAHRVMRGFGLGVDNVNMSKIRQSKPRREKLSGRILIAVEDKGAAFYINPVDLALYSLGVHDRTVVSVLLAK